MNLRFGGKLPAAIIGNTNSACMATTPCRRCSRSVWKRRWQSDRLQQPIDEPVHHETRAIWDTINTNLALEVEFNQGQPDLLSYLTNQAAINANARVSCRQTRTEPQVGSAPPPSWFNPSSWKPGPTCPGCFPSFPAGCRILADGLAQIAEGFTRRTSCRRAQNSVRGTQALWCGGEEDAESPDENCAEIGNVKTLIGDLSTNINYRFDRVTSRSSPFSDTLNTEFEKIPDWTKPPKASRITKHLGNRAIFQQLLLVQQDLHRLERQLFESFNDLARHDWCWHGSGTFLRNRKSWPMTWAGTALAQTPTRIHSIIMQ